MLRDCDESIVDLFVSHYEKSDSPEEKNRIALILAEVCRPELIKKVLAFSLSNTLTLEETAFLILAVAKNSTNKGSLKLAWTFIKSHWSQIHTLYANSILFARLMKPFVENFSTQVDLDEVERYFADKNVAELSGAIRKGIETIKSNICWLNGQEKYLAMFFSQI